MKTCPTYSKLTQLTQNLPEIPKTSQSYPKLTRFTQNIPYLPRTYQRGHINVRLVYTSFCQGVPYILRLLR